MRALAGGGASDTIFALASGIGRSAVALIRVSGPTTKVIVTQLCGKLPAPREARLHRLRDADGATLDQAIVLWMPGPASYTGEDGAELHVHGGPAVLAGVTGTLVARGARPADPGEFTRRAFTNRKLGLLEAEAVASLVDAETALQRDAALLQLSGAQSRKLKEWTDTLNSLLAYQEALIDFADDEIPTTTVEFVTTGIQALQVTIAREMEASTRGERLRRGLLVVIAGAPNAGKSSLLNALAGRDAAIVSPAPGTTRDAVQVNIEIAGVPVSLVDTAGLRETSDPIESEGVRRAQDYINEADVIIHLIMDEGLPIQQGGSGHIIEVRSKTDLLPAPKGMIGVNVVQPHGLDALVAQLSNVVRNLTMRSAQPAFSTARHAAALRDTHSALLAAATHRQPDLCAEELRLAAASLGRLTGLVDVEDVLNTIFSSFCIGK